MTNNSRPAGGSQCRCRSLVFRVAAAALFATTIIAIAPAAVLAEESTAPLKTFDLPGGDAVATLRQFTVQSGVQLVYLEDSVRGAVTKPVKGMMTAREALTIMFAGTSLEIAEDARTGALTVHRKDAPKLSYSAPGASSDIIKLNPFEVSSTSYNGYAASQTVSGSKIATRLIDSIETINVVTQDMINDLGYQDPNDFLPASTAAVSNYAISSANQGVYIRGFRAQNWSVDGATEASFAQLDNFNFNSFEIVKGPSALLFGPFGAFGGYVNMVPKYAGQDGEVNQVQFTVGTNDYTSELIDVGAALTTDGVVQGRLVGGEYDAHRAGKPGDFTHNHTIAPSITINISKKTQLKFRLDLESSHVRNSEDAENAAGVVLRNFTDDGPEGLQPDLGVEDRSTETQTVLTSQLTDDWSFKLNFMTDAELYVDDQVLLAQDAATGLVGSNQYPQETYQYQKLREKISYHSWYGGAATNWKVPEIGHGFSNDATVSGDMYEYSDNYIFYANLQTATMYPQYNVAPYTTFDPSNPNYSSIANMSLLIPQMSEPYATEWLGGIDGLDTFGAFNKKLQLVLGTRYNYDSRYSYNTTRSTPTAPLAGTPSTDVIEELWLNRYGLVFQPIPEVSLYYGHDEGYISVGVGYTFQGALIQPQAGKENEVGIKTDMFHALGGEWSSQLSYFMLNVTNINIADPAHQGYYLEEAAEKNDGFDAQITYQGDKLSGTIGYYDANGPYNPITGIRVPYSPKTTFVSLLKYNITPAIAFGGNWRWQGNSLDGFSNRVLAPYDTLGLFATYTKNLSKGKMIWRLGMSNVTNATAAYMMVSPERVFTEDGRETKLSLSYVW